MVRLATRRLAPASWLVAALAVLTATCSPKVTAPPEPPMSVNRGDQAFRYEDYPTAINSYRNYLAETDRGPYTARVFYKTALAQYRLGQYRETLATLDELGRRYPRVRWVQVEALRGDAQRELGRSVMALHAWDAGWQAANDRERPKLRQRVAAVARGLSDADLAKARRVVNSEGVQRVLDRQIATRQPSALNDSLTGSSEEGETALTPAEAETAPSAPTKRRGKSQARAAKGAGHTAAHPTGKTTAPTASEESPQDASAGATAEVSEAPAEVQEAPTEVQEAPSDEELSWLPPIAALREAPGRPTDGMEGEPLPGAIAEAPEAAPATDHDEPVQGSARVGCLLPLSGSDMDSGQRSLRGLRLIFPAKNDRLVVKDTASDPSVAAVRFDELAHDPHVVVVVGPVRKEDVDTVAPLAEQAYLTALLLAPRSDASARFAVQAGITPSHQVAELLDYVMQAMRLRRFGVLYPKDSSGEESLSAFRAAVEQRGGTVVGANGYDAGNRGLAVGEVKRWRNAQNLQALFVPDNATVAAQFAHFLQREMPDVPLLGVQSWQTLAGHSDGAGLNGIVFVDGFYADSARPGTREFVDRFVAAYGTTPGTLEAQAYDAALLVKRALNARANSRADVLRILQALGPVEGATGTLQFGPGGVQREMFLLQVFDGQLREVGTAG